MLVMLAMEMPGERPPHTTVGQHEPDGQIVASDYLKKAAA